MARTSGGPKGALKAPTPPHVRLPVAQGMKPLTIRPAVAGAIKPNPPQTRDYAKQSPISVQGATDDAFQP